MSYCAVVVLRVAIPASIPFLSLHRLCPPVCCSTILSDEWTTPSTRQPIPSTLGSTRIAIRTTTNGDRLTMELTRTLIEQASRSLM